MNSRYRRQAIAKHVLPIATRLLLEQCISIGSPIEPLKKVVDLNMGQSPRGASYNTDGFGMPFIGGPADLGRKYPQTRRWTSEPTKTCQPGDIIICVRATIGKPRWSDGEYCLGRGVAGLRPKSNRLNSRFLFRCLVNLEEELQSKGTGTTFKTVSKKHIEALPIPLPSPEYQEQIADYLDWLEARSEAHESAGDEPRLPTLFDEQRRIVARIEELAALIEEAQGLRVKAREETATLVAAAVVELFTAHQDNDWTDYRLGDLVTEFRYGTSEKAHNEPSGTPILRMGNIQDGRLDLADLKYLYLTDRDREKLLLQPGDVLVNRTNSPELVGKCAVFEEEGEYAFASYLIRLRLDLTKAVPQLVAAYTNSPVGRAYMFSHRKQMTGQANVNTKTLKAMPISLPPVEEQRRIVTYLGSLQAQADELTVLQDATQAELDALLPSVLDRAFKGEL